MQVDLGSYKQLEEAPEFKPSYTGYYYLGVRRVCELTDVWHPDPAGIYDYVYLKNSYHELKHTRQ